MSDAFEQQLRHAMRRSVDVPSGLQDRIIEQCEQERRRAVPRQKPRIALPRTMLARTMLGRWVGGALAAALVAGVGTGLLEREHERREARRQFTVALQVTSRALEETRQQLSRAGIRLED